MLTEFLGMAWWKQVLWAVFFLLGFFTLIRLGSKAFFKSKYEAISESKKPKKKEESEHE